MVGLGLLGEFHLEDLLVTAYPGSEGLLVEGTLTTPLRRNPRSVILFHGIERADPSVTRLLLHILERGALADAQGERAERCLWKSDRSGNKQQSVEKALQMLIAWGEAASPRPQ